MILLLQSKIKDNRCLDLNKSTLFYQCIWDKPNAKRDFWINVREFVVKARIAMAMVYGLVIYPVGSITSRGDITGVCEGVILTFIVSMAFVKAFHVVMAPETFQGLAETVEEMYHNEYIGSKINEDEKAIRDETQKYTNWAIYYYLLAAFAIVLYSLGLFPLLLYIRRLYVGGWYPFPVEKSPYFELSLISLAILILCLSLVPCVDSFLMALMIQTIGQFKLLRYNLRNLHKLSVDTVIGKRITQKRNKLPHHIRKLKAVSRFKSSMLRKKRSWDFLLDVPMSISRTNVVGKKHNFAICPKVSQRKHMSVDGEKSSFQLEVNIEMDIRLRKCIQHHQELCSLTGRLEAAMTYILMNQLSCNIIPSVTIMIWLTLVESVDERALGIIVLGCACLFELLMLCYLGNEITDENDKMRDDVYGCGWYEASESFKRSMRIMMAQANVPLDITIGGLVPLSMETFQAVVNNVYQTFTTLQSMV